MSTTTTINPTNSGNSTDGKKKAAAFAATATAAAGAGVAGAHIVSELNDTEDAALEENVVPEEVADSSAQTETTAGAATTSATATTSSPSVSTSAASTAATSSVEPQPITTGDVVDVETEVTVEPATDPTATATTEVTEPGSVNNTTNEVVNPDDVAQAIISEERIDPNDIDMADVINFDEIGTVYTVDGESYTAATFHDAGGNGFVMVDVDGDDVFDVITDYDGNLLAEVPGNISVGDAQEDIQDDGEYLAYDGDLDNVDEYGADSLADDLMA